MTIGDGDIASVLPESKFLFFASGVSNSQETRESEYRREKDLLLGLPRNVHIVYFSSLGVLDGDTRYYEHKRSMEALVKHIFVPYTIIRLGNIDFGTNPYTLINYLKAHPEAELRDEWRYICSKDELLHWIDKIPDWNCEMNIPGERLKVKEIWERYVKK